MKPENIVKRLDLETDEDIRSEFNQLKRVMPASTLVEALRISKPSSRSRHLLCDIAGYRRIKRAVPSLLETLRVSPERVRGAAAEALMKIGDVRTGPELYERLQLESSVGVRQSLILALGTTKYSAGVPCLLSLLDDQCETTRGCAAWSLGELVGNEDVKVALTDRVSKETSEYVCTQMRDALVKICEA